MTKNSSAEQFGSLRDQHFRLGALGGFGDFNPIREEVLEFLDVRAGETRRAARR